jgi:hypothetical protein
MRVELRAMPTEIEEALSVAFNVVGGSSLMHAADAMAAVEELSTLS